MNVSVFRREERSDTPTHDEPPSGPPRLPDTSVPPPNFGSSGALAPPGVDDAYLGPRPTGGALPPTHVPPPGLDYRRIESVVPPTRYRESCCLVSAQETQSSKQALSSIQLYELTKNLTWCIHKQLGNVY